MHDRGPREPPEVHRHPRPLVERTRKRRASRPRKRELDAIAQRLRAKQAEFWQLALRQEVAAVVDHHPEAIAREPPASHFGFERRNARRRLEGEDVQRSDANRTHALFRKAGLRPSSSERLTRHGCAARGGPALRGRVARGGPAPHGCVIHQRLRRTVAPRNHLERAGRFRLPARGCARRRPSGRPCGAG